MIRRKYIMAELKSQMIKICVHRNLSVFSFCLGLSRGVNFVCGEDELGGGLLGCSLSFCKPCWWGARREAGNGGGGAQSLLLLLSFL